MLALQLGNVYALIALIGFGVLYQTNDPKVVRNYLIACAVGDIGHIWQSYVGIGHANFMAVQSWNSMTWGNVGVTALLLVTRVGYLLGLFGQDRVVASARKTI